jgi:hypothetical protein
MIVIHTKSSTSEIGRVKEKETELGGVSVEGDETEINGKSGSKTELFLHPI